MSARSWASALRRSPAARCPISISWARKNSSSCATSSRPNTARASPRRNSWSRWRPRARPSTAASRRKRWPRRRARPVIARSACDEAIQGHKGTLDCFASLAMTEGSRRLHQAFLGERFLHLGARGDAGLEGHQIVQAGEVHLVAVGPAQHGIEIAVGDRELLAHQIVAADKLLIGVLDLAHDAVLEDGFHLVGDRWVEQRAEVLVQLGGDEVEPFL